MNMSANRRWVLVTILVGVLYLVVGIAFGGLARSAVSNQTRVIWRLAAWLVSAAAFGAHIAYEHYRLRNSPRAAAFHVSLAVALGAFALAVAANVHALGTATGDHRLLAFALVAFPAVTAVPAFVVALAASAVLARTGRGV